MNLYSIELSINDLVSRINEIKGNAIFNFMKYLEKQFPMGNFMEVSLDLPYKRHLLSDIEFNPKLIKQYYVAGTKEIRPIVVMIRVRKIKTGIKIEDINFLKYNDLKYPFLTCGRKKSEVFKEKEKWFHITALYGHL